MIDKVAKLRLSLSNINFQRLVRLRRKFPPYTLEKQETCGGTINSWIID